MCKGTIGAGGGCKGAGWRRLQTSCTYARAKPEFQSGGRPEARVPDPRKWTADDNYTRVAALVCTGRPCLGFFYYSSETFLSSHTHVPTSITTHTHTHSRSPSLSVSRPGVSRFSRVRPIEPRRYGNDLFFLIFDFPSETRAANYGGVRFLRAPIPPLPSGPPDSDETHRK